MNGRPLSLALLLIGLGVCLVDGRAVDRRGPQAAAGFYAEPQLIELLTKVFADWQGDKSEKLIFITADGQVFIFRNHDPHAVSINLLDIIKTLARKGQHLGTVSNIIHSHKWPDGFSPTDVALCKTLRKVGFTGAFQLFYPEPRRIKILKRRNYARA